MPLQEPIDSLRAKHARLEALIAEELGRPLPDQARLSRLKKEKLRIKERIAELEKEASAATTHTPSAA